MHGSGPNSLTTPRVAYAVQFSRDDVNWFDRETGQWKAIKQFPRWKTGPVETIRVPTGKTDGH